MARIAEPYIVRKRGKSFQLTLNSTCGLPQRICADWRRRSFKALPEELFNYRTPQTKPEAKASAQVLIAFLKKKLENGGDQRKTTEGMTVGDWMKKFTRIETSPRTGINASKNRPYSVDTLDGYKTYYDCHIKDDPITALKMAETEEEDVLEFMSRLSVKKKIIGKKQSDQTLGGTRTAAGVIGFLFMAFKQYQHKNRWLEKCFFHPVS